MTGKMLLAGFGLARVERRIRAFRLSQAPSVRLASPSLSPKAIQATKRIKIGPREATKRIKIGPRKPWPDLASNQTHPYWL